MKVNKNLQPVSIPIEPHNRHIEMTPKEALEAIRAEFQSKAKSPANLTPEYRLVKQALNEFEHLKEFKQTFDAYELSKKQDFIAYENWQECEAFIAKTIAILKSRIGINLYIIESEPISTQDKNNLLAENIGMEFAIMLLEYTD